MTPADCLALFGAAPDSLDRASFVDRGAPECSCEQRQVSGWCSDAVRNEETLVRLIVDPTHVHHEDGAIRLKTAFFSDAQSVGASCLRKERAAEVEYHRTFAEILKHPTASDGSIKSLYGAVVIPVAVVRNVLHKIELSDPKRTETPRAFCVYATGLEFRPNHADVLVNRVSTITRSAANRAGINLTKAIAQDLQTVEEFKDIVDLTAYRK